jgi:hypothetical protein
VTLSGIKKSGKKPGKKPGKKSEKEATTNLKKKAKDVVKEPVDKMKPSGKKHAANRLKALAKKAPEKIKAGSNLKIARKKVANKKSEKKDKHTVTIEAAPEGIPAANERESKSILVSFKSLFRDCKSYHLYYDIMS